MTETASDNVEFEQVRKNIAIVDNDTKEPLSPSSCADDDNNSQPTFAEQELICSTTSEVTEESENSGHLEVQKFRKGIITIESDLEEESISSSLVQKYSAFTYEKHIEQDECSSTDKEINNTKVLPSQDETSEKHCIQIPGNSSEDSDGVTNDSIADEIEKNPEATIYTTNHKGELIAENSEKKKAMWTALCDSESSDEEVNQEPGISSVNIDESLFEEPIEPIPYKKKCNSRGREKEKKMTGKEAAEARKEIQSESQRMVREMDVSLPYHKPKQFTLKEFLSRRPKLSSFVPSASKMSPSLAMKMSNDQLKDVLKKLEDRKKEVQQFYKSDSEPEDDGDYDKNDTDYIPPDDKASGNILHDQVQEMSDCDEAVKFTKNVELVGVTQDSGIDSQEVVGNVEERKFDEHESNKNDMKEQALSDEPEHIIKESVKVNSGENLNNRVSTDYEFNLDDIEDNSERIIRAESIEHTEKNDKTGRENVIDAISLSPKYSNKPEDSNEPEDSNQPEDSHQPEGNCFSGEFVHNQSNPPKQFEYTELDEEIEHFDNTEDVNEVEKTKLSKIDLIRERLSSVQPRLSGDRNHVIDLDTCIPRPNQVTELMNRFLQHNTKNHHHKNRVKMNIVSVESGQIHKEILAINVDDENDPTEIEEKPGAKLSKLRGELRDQIKQHRAEIWQKKTVLNDTERSEKDPYDGEKSDCGGDDDILDVDEEEEMSESSEEENEDEEEELPKMKNSAFMDDEAEESDREEDFDNEENNIGDKSENDDVAEGDEDSVLSNVEREPVSNKPLKRIVRGFTEDSDDEDTAFSSKNDSGIEKLNKSITEEITQDDDYIPPYQLQNSGTPIKKIPSTKFDHDFFTPISYITGLQNLNCTSKPRTSDESSFRMPNVPSPLKDSNWQSNLQKKLFSESEVTSSQAEAIANMCSSTFADSQEIADSKSHHQNSNHVLDSQKDLPSTAPPNTQDLLEICSGNFSQTADSDIPASLPPSSQDLLDVCSGDFGSREKSVVTHEFGRNGVEEVKQLGAEEDAIISQLLDEEEMATFRRKFDSPMMSDSQKRIVEEFEGGSGVIDSDDEDEGLAVKKKRKQMRLTFSDSEDSDNDEDQKEEEIDLHDDIEEDNDVPADNIGYDSEENEVEYVDDGDDDHQGPKPLKMADFFEDEAELSESEWGSADEDEKDLDTLEFEQGDTEKFDEKQMRSELERIHMRRMLDDDTREVKLLQELLLEDGELHGSGRARQFKWKNLDSVDDDDDGKKDDEDNVAYIEEDESEEQWRRKRFEREMFLKEKQSKSLAVADDDDVIVEESQFLKIGHKVIERSQTSSQGSVSTGKQKAAPRSPDIKSTFSFMNKRGSFLSRNDQVLQRLAEYNKQTTNLALGTATAKNSRNFLFQTVSVEKTSSNISMKKRKTTDDTPKAIKKLRLSDNFSPAVKKKPERPGVKAKLFGNP